MGHIKAVLFDMDGVLIDAKEWHYEALNRALGLFGLEISRYDHLVTYDGLPTRKKLEMLSLEKGLSKGLHDFISKMKQLYTLELVHARCKPRFNHERALSSLKALGYKLAVCSNSVSETIELMMLRAGLASYLEFYLSNEDVTHAKPHPEMYQTAIERLGLSPVEVLIVEDNPNGVKAARASGAHILQVESVNEVTLSALQARITEIERGIKASCTVPANSNQVMRAA